MPEATEDPHTVMHIYEGDGGVIIRENGNVSSFGVQSPEVRAAFSAAASLPSDDEVGRVVSEWRKAMEDVAARGPWRVASDHPALAIACGDYRVVQTPNQNNHRHFGAAERWHGIESYALANWIARCSPDSIGSLLALIQSQAAALAGLRAAMAEADKALEPFAAEFDKRANLAPGPDIDHWPIGGSSLTLGDLRAARRAHSKDGGEHA